MWRLGKIVADASLNRLTVEIEHARSGAMLCDLIWRQPDTRWIFASRSPANRGGLRIPKRERIDVVRFFGDALERRLGDSGQSPSRLSLILELLPKYSAIIFTVRRCW